MSSRLSALGSRLSALGALGALGALLVIAACGRENAPAARASADTTAGDTGAFRPLVIGEAVPGYAAARIGGLVGDSVRIDAADRASVVKGSPTLVNVWATWCTSCREEFADLERLHRDYGPRGLRVVAVSVDESGDERVVRFVKSQGVTFTIAHDAEGRIQRLYQTVGVPETYLVSGDGKLLWRHGGALRDGAPEAREAIDRALGSDTR